MKQCAVMFVNPERKPSTHVSYLRDTGFLVSEIHDWPDSEGAIRDYHVVIVRVRDIAAAPMLAARLRAKPHFGRRLLIALVPPASTPHDRRNALASGFDHVVTDACESRDLTARVLRTIRARPELKCALPSAA